MTAKGQVRGAVLAKHRVSVDFKGIDGRELARKVDAAYAKKPSMSERELLAVEQKIRQSMMKKLGGQKVVPKSYNKNTKLRLEVTGPTDNANFDLKSDGS